MSNLQEQIECITKAWEFGSELNAPALIEALKCIDAGLSALKQELYSIRVRLDMLEGDKAYKERQ